MPPASQRRPRRSCLAVPGSNPRFHAKADQSAADMIFLDLEDAVAPSAKEEARELVVSALNQYAFESKVRGVRINDVTTRWCGDDVREVVEGAGERLDCLVVPKVEDQDHVHFVHHLLNQLEAKLGLSRRIGLELQLETARGLENASRMAAASDRTETLIFGPVDLAADLRLPSLRSGDLRDDYPGDFWHHFHATVLVAARAHGLQAIDGPYVQVRDLAGLRRFAARSAALGYDGKWALNPAQIEVLNEVYAPSPADFRRALEIVEAYRQATDAESRGAVMLGDEMIDEASRKLAQVMVERGRAAGLEEGT
ncbi:MAG: HpcH/HpaI aldolase/citrate lyase family protein [Candidatus Dormibacter sp.]|uniref:HpcH/HpaI aldolase/citrate lyase family protein n=1 Tax=Candidatus Dormibacter sp. TaxID=2973982 RepID=UPI003D9B913B